MRDRSIRVSTLVLAAAAALGSAASSPSAWAQAASSDSSNAYCVGAIQTFSANLDKTLPPNMPPEIRQQAQGALAQQRQFADQSVRQLIQQLTAKRLWPAPAGSPIATAVNQGNADASMIVNSEQQCMTQCAPQLGTQQGGSCMDSCMSPRVSADLQTRLNACPSPPEPGNGAPQQ